MGHETPCTPGACHRKDALANLAVRVQAVASVASLFAVDVRKERSKGFPLLLGQVGWVSTRFHEMRIPGFSTKDFLYML